jgi:hypothetical protein
MRQCVLRRTVGFVCAVLLGTGWLLRIGGDVHLTHREVASRPAGVASWDGGLKIDDPAERPAKPYSRRLVYCRGSFTAVAGESAASLGGVPSAAPPAPSAF